MKKAVLVALYILLLLAWGYGGFYLFIIAMFSECFTPVTDLLGKWPFWLGDIALICIIISPFFLHRKLKRKWLSPIIAFAASIVFVICAFTISGICCSKFKDFTPEKWAEYPRQRVRMMDGLKAEYDIIGMSRDEIVGLLGEPEYMGESVYEDTLTYRSNCSRIDFYFTDGKLSDTHIFY